MSRKEANMKHRISNYYSVLKMTVCMIMASFPEKKNKKRNSHKLLEGFKGWRIYAFIHLVSHTDKTTHNVKKASFTLTMSLISLRNAFLPHFSP